LISAGGKYASLYETWINSTSGESND
jgi:hypothetical protein